MKKIMALLIFFLITSCKSITVFNNNINTNQNFEKEIVKNYNKYVSNYNLITEKIKIILDNYNDLCGFSELPVINNKNKIKQSIDYVEFSNFISELKPIDDEDEKFKNIKFYYNKTLETLNPLYENYDSSFSYYNNRNEDFPDMEILHKNFIFSYISFKNYYYDFANEIFKLHDRDKYKDAIYYKDVSLNIHSEMIKLIIIFEELESKYLKIDKENFINTKNDIMQTNKLIYKQLKQINTFTEKEVNNYFINDNQKNAFNNYKTDFKNIEKIYNFIKECDKLDFLTYKQKITNINNDLKTSKNKLVINYNETFK